MTAFLNAWSFQKLFSTEFLEELVKMSIPGSPPPIEPGPLGLDLNIGFAYKLPKGCLSILKISYFGHMFVHSFIIQ